MSGSGNFRYVFPTSIEQSPALGAFFINNVLWENLQIVSFTDEHVHTTNVLATCHHTDFLDDTYFMRGETDIQKNIFNSHIGEEIFKQFKEHSKPVIKSNGSLGIFISPTETVDDDLLFTVMIHLCQESQTDNQHLPAGFKGTYIQCPRCHSALLIRSGNIHHIDIFGHEFTCCEEGVNKDKIKKEKYINVYRKILPCTKL